MIDSLGLTEHFLREEVSSLRRELEAEKAKALELREEIKRLFGIEKKYKQQVKLKSKHQCENSRLREKYGIKRPSRCERAREIISRREQGLEDRTLKSIAAEFFLSYSTVKSLARDLRKK